jgi:hypothetical protein
MLSGVSQGSTLEPLLFSNFNNDLRIENHFSKFLLFANNLKIFNIIKSLEVFEILQSDIDYAQNWCFENYMKINVFKTNIIPFTRKSNSIHFNYFLVYLLIVRPDCVNDLEVILGTAILSSC